MSTAMSAAVSAVVAAATPWRLLAAVLAWLLLLSAVHPIGDVDVYWHVLIGQEILRERSVSHLGETFSFAPELGSWTTTQWLPEVLFAWIHHVAGWTGFVVLTATVGLLVAGGLAGLVLRGRRTPAAAVIYLAALVVAAAHLQERPQLLSLLFLLWLSRLVVRALTDRLPSHLEVLGVTALWANVHGLWVLVPSVLGLLTIGVLLEKQRGATRRLVTLGATALVAGCLTPVGPKLLLTPVAFASAGSHLQEWQPTQFRDVSRITFVLLVAALVAAWARGRDAVPLRELVLVGGVVAFALVVQRNVPPAGLLLAPVAAARVAALSDRRDEPRNDRERTAVATLIAVVVGAAVVTVLGRAATTPPLTDVPRELAERLAREPGQHLVLNDYDASGAILFWGGPRTRVAVDGRADLYGADRVRAHLDLLALRGPWRERLAELPVNYALLSRRAPLRDELLRLGWTTMDTDDQFVLLRRGAA